MCKVLGVRRSGYYAWLNRLPSKRDQERRELVELIEEIYAASFETYGNPRIQAEMVSRGLKVSGPRVARIMKAEGIQSKIRNKYKITTESKHDLNIAPNLLNREFKVDRPSRVWVSDLTYINTKEGWLYLTVVIDLYDRKVIGWALSKTMKGKATTISSLKNRTPLDGLIFHSDRGVQYACSDFVQLLDNFDITQSMSRKGNCWDNAVAESFFKTIKVECIYRSQYSSRHRAKMDIFSYIEIWYNRKRRHSSLGYVGSV